MKKYYGAVPRSSLLVDPWEYKQDHEDVNQNSGRTAKNGGRDAEKWRLRRHKMVAEISEWWQRHQRIMVEAAVEETPEKRWHLTCMHLFRVNKLTQIYMQ